MRVYVWENVLRDWTCGLVVVHAGSKAKALKILEKKAGVYGRDLDELKTTKPRVLRPGQFALVYGGG